MSALEKPEANSPKAVTIREVGPSTLDKRPEPAERWPGIVRHLKAEQRRLSRHDSA